MEEGQMRANGYDTQYLTLERRLSGVLAEDSKAITAATLRALMEETEGAIVDAQEWVRVAEQAAYDPSIVPDISDARKQMEEASLRVGRLQTLLTRLQRRHVQVAEAERLKQWKRDFADSKKQRDDLANELAKVYPEVIAKLADLFTRIAILDQKLSTLHQARPSGVALHLTGSELVARELERFSRDVPSLLQAVTLFDFHTGKRVWPPVQKRDMSMFDPQRYADPRASRDWWKFAEADAAHAKAESARVQEYYEKQQRKREET
jgi:hypothetical protein